MSFLTRQEKGVLILLCVGILCGISYRFYSRHFFPIGHPHSRPRSARSPLTRRLDTLVSADRRLTINTASETDLIAVRGIGPVLAARILEYRKIHGPYSSPEELLNVPGIGPRTLDTLRDSFIFE